MPEFGTSGLRGLAVELTDELVASYAAAFASLHAHNGTLYVGQDRRESSVRISNAVAQGAAYAGLVVRDCGVLPTPALADAAMKAGTISIMVTGSHIPADRNGLKFYTSTGEFTKADEAPLVAAVADGNWGVGEPAITSDPDARASFVRRYVQGLPVGALNGMKIGVWLHSSAAYQVLPEILKGLGADVVPLGASSDFVPVDTEALGDDAQEMLSAWVETHELDALVSTDGDADRPLLIDEHGRQVPGDILGAITSRWLRAEKVVTTVSANSMVEEMGVFENVERTRIGSPYVIAAMESLGQGKVAGYEPNGGFLLGWDVKDAEISLRHLMTRDSMLPLVATLASAAEQGSISDLLRQLPSRRTSANRLQNVPRDVSLSVVERILKGDMSMLPNGLGSANNIDTTDGVRVSFDSGKVVHIRPSGNAPELRCYVEADSQKDADEVLQQTLVGLRNLI